MHSWRDQEEFQVWPSPKLMISLKSGSKVRSMGITYDPLEAKDSNYGIEGYPSIMSSDLPMDKGNPLWFTLAKLSSYSYIEMSYV